MIIFSLLFLLIFVLCAEVTPVEDPSHSGAKKSKSCYFSTPKLSPLEKYVRPRSSRTKSSCSDELIDFSSLANNVDGDFLGAPHEMALIDARFEGNFVDENSDLSPWKGTMICTNHLNELSRDFENVAYHHRKWDDNGALLCGFPEPDHKGKAVKNFELTYPQSQYLLESRGFLLLPATPLCKIHHRELLGNSRRSTLNLEERKDTATPGDAGFPAEDAGFPAEDAGFPAEDAGFPAADAGFPAADAGFPAADAGFPAEDAGFPAADTGFPAEDPGFPAADAGFPAADPGFPAADPGFPAGDGEVESMIIDEEAVCEKEGDDDPDYKARITPSSLRSFFHQFAKEGGVTRVRCSKSWTKITNRDKNYRVHGLAELVEIELGLLADTPDGKSELKKMLIDVLQGKSASMDETFVADQMLTVMADQYKKATNTQARVYTLAPFTQLFDYPTVSQYIEGLSHRLWSQAVRLSIDHNSLIPPELRIVDRICPVKLAFYVYFLTSPHVLIELPYGSSTVTDSQGNVHFVTNAIRQTGIYETIEMYITYMKEAGLESLLLHRTTMYHILTYLPIKKAHSLMCVDYFQADATNGFIEIHRMIDELVKDSHLDKSDAVYLKRQFDELKLYLRGNYRFHVKLESLYSDHCALWALSDPINEHFASHPSSHQHKQRCSECKAIDDVIRDVKALLKQCSEKKNLPFEMQKKLDGFVHDFDLNVEKIYDLKAHYARSVYASMERERIVKAITENQAVLTIDYSQKWEGTQFREAQSEYYGKAGSSWHVIHVQAIIEGKAVNHAATHLMGEIEQDAIAVVAMLEHFLEELHRMGITDAHIRSDNAPYYHCAALIASMPGIASRSKVNVLSYSFSEKQAGKSPADRFIGLLKRSMRGFRDKQHKVITPAEMFEALTTGKQLRGVSVYLVEKIEEKKRSTTKIPKITELSHFEYHGSSARAWRFYGIGDGITLGNLEPSEAKLKIAKNGRGGKLASDEVNLQDRQRIRDSKGKAPGEYEEPTFWILPHERAPQHDVEPNNRDDDIVNPKEPNPNSIEGSSHKSLFYCKHPFCGASFVKESNLVKHQNKGDHKKRPDRTRWMDRALRLFSRSIERVLTHVGLAPVSEVEQAFTSKTEPELPKGWALRSARKTGRYPETTKMFIKGKFDEYAKGGMKLRADQAERLMREDKQIMPREWMTKNQIRNYINSLKSQKPKLRVWRRALEHEEEEEHDHHVEVEVHEIQDEDIDITDDDWYHTLTQPILKLIFSHVDDPKVHRTPIPDGTTEFD